MYAYTYIHTYIHTYYIHIQAYIYSGAQISGVGLSGHSMLYGGGLTFMCPQYRTCITSPFGRFES